MPGSTVKLLIGHGGTIISMLDTNRLNIKCLRNNSLSLVFFLLFMVSLLGQVVTGLQEHNQELQEEGGSK